MASKAAESLQVQKARKKLEQKFAQEEKRVNQAAIDQMKKTIQLWISRHQSDRIKLKKKTIELFDENRHSAKTKSKFIAHLAHKLEKGPAPAKPLKTLKGRITI